MTLRRVSVFLVATLAAAIVVPQAMAAKPPQVKATFGPGLSFNVVKKKKLVSTGENGTMSLKRGRYRLVLKDNASNHNYRLVNARGKTITGKFGKKRKKVLTGVGAMRAKPFIYVVSLKKGVYTLICDPHRNVGMTVKIRVK